MRRGPSDLSILADTVRECLMQARASRREPPNEDYDALFEFSSTPTLELDAAGIVVRMNAAAARLLDLRPQRAVGSALDDLIAADVTSALAQERPVTVTATTATGRESLVVRSMRRTFHGSDGDRFTVQLSLAPGDARQDATRSGEPLHWSAMDDISHNLGTPLSIIGGFASTLLTHADELGPDALAKAASAIHRHATRAIDELQALQARVRLDAGGAGTVPTSVLVAWLRRMLDPNLAAANAALVGSWTVDAVTLDIAVARQALLNMCTVALQVEPRPRTLELAVATSERGTVFELAVDAAGAPVRTDPIAQFTIDVTASLARTHGGTYRPPTPEDPSQELVLPSTAPHEPGAAPTIAVAVIEDDPDTAALIRTSLRNSSTLFRVVADERTFADGLRSLAACRPRIVLLDQNLPDRNATEGLAEVRAAAPDARIVVLSVRSRRDEDSIDDQTVWLEKGRVLADLGTELIGVLATGD